MVVSAAAVNDAARTTYCRQKTAEQALQKKATPSVTGRTKGSSHKGSNVNTKHGIPWSLLLHQMLAYSRAR